MAGREEQCWHLSQEAVPHHPVPTMEEPLPGVPTTLGTPDLPWCSCAPSTPAPDMPQLLNPFQIEIPEEKRSRKSQVFGALPFLIAPSLVTQTSSGYEAQLLCKIIEH